MSYRDLLEAPKPKRQPCSVCRGESVVDMGQGAQLCATHDAAWCAHVDGIVERREWKVGGWWEAFGAWMKSQRRAA